MKSNNRKNSVKNTKRQSKKEDINLVQKSGRTLGFTVFIIILLIILVFRLSYLQFIKGPSLKEAATKQQTTSRIISPNRGSIYDSTGKPLAISAKVDTVTINPQKFVISDGDNSQEKTANLQEKVSKAFAEIFELEYDDVYQKVTSNSSIQTIAKKVEEEKINKLKAWMEENEINDGINIDTDTKRYCYYNNLASNLIGFCGDDNQGLAGLEYYWNSVLTGTPGKIITSQDAHQDIISNNNENYIPAQNGSNITLTIDYNIQTIAEKYLKQAVADNNCNRGGNIIVMDPKTGDILAMASYPDYNLNSPFTPNETLSKTWDSLSASAKSTALQNMWKNISVTNTYEPGSVFKVLISAIALEENLVETDTPGIFSCIGYQDIYGTQIGCAKTSGHGYQSLREALEHSCNPAFMQLGAKIGKETLYKYFDAFGLFDKTGIATAGEAVGTFHNLDKVGPVELATISFGQRFTITPLQMITSVCAIANDGVLMQPRIVKSIQNTDTGTVTTIEPKEVRQVISSETAEQVRSMMESVVVEGGGRYGQVSGYNIGGKTGTSEASPGKEEEGTVASFLAIAPVENTKVAVLLTLYDPAKSNNYGGQIAAPVVAQVLSEVLPYLEIPSNNTTITTTPTDTYNSLQTTALPDVKNKTVAQAKKILENAGFKYETSSTDDSIVSEQVPKPGTGLVKGALVKLYTNNNSDRTSVEVPSVKGLTAVKAKNTLLSNKLNVKVVGTGKVVSQDPIAGTNIEEGSVVTITLQDELDSGSH
ncbi:MAG: PASTA domain-containing protein [Clostridia bacterium]|nr:PASTA domain-containing protein [Clostridia bacterium]